jgi:hypothetical protein
MLVVFAAALTFSAHARVYNASLFATRGSSAKESRARSSGYSAIAILHGDYKADSHVSFGTSLETVSGDRFTPQSALTSVLESYAVYSNGSLNGKLGNQLFTSPWAGSHDVYGSAPAAFQGLDVTYARKPWLVEAAHFTRYHAFAATSFSRNTLLTPGINTGGFDMLHTSYTPDGLSLNAYGYNMHDILNAVWVTAKVRIHSPSAPFIAAQYGTQVNSGASVLGRLRSTVVGLQAGFNASRTVSLSAGYNAIPWRNVRTVIPHGATCNSGGAAPTYQISSGKGTLPYFLPGGAAQCVTHPDGTTTFYTGGWASPYSDSFAADPLFTTSLIEGMVDRRSPGEALYVEFDYNSMNGRFSVMSSRAAYNYSNSLARQTSGEWDTIFTYRFAAPAQGTYKGLLARFGYIQIFKTNTAYSDGSPFLGGHPTLHYRRVQIEYSL